MTLASSAVAEVSAAEVPAPRASTGGQASAKTAELVAPVGAPASPPAAPVNAGPGGSRGGGASAQREYERRSGKREARIRSAHPRLGGLILALSEGPASTRVWAQGARGERAVAAALEEQTDGRVVALHDRAMRRPDGRLSRANIDHIAIAPTGVWVIDAKTHHGQLEVRRTGGLFTPRTETLHIGGRNQTKLLDGLARQVDAVAAELARAAAPVPVHGALCFVGTDLPWSTETIGGIPLVGRRGLVKLLTRPGNLDGEDRQAVARYLHTRFPTAT